MTPEEEAARWPEHAKLDNAASVEERQAIGGFLDWLRETKGYYLAQDDGGYGGYLAVYTSTSTLIAEYLGIDMKAYDAESTDMYRHLAEQINK